MRALEDALGTRLAVAEHEPLVDQEERGAVDCRPGKKAGLLHASAQQAFSLAGFENASVTRSWEIHP